MKAIYLKPSSVIKARLGLQPNGPAHKFFTQTCAIHMDKYVPFRTGALATTVVNNGVPTNNVKTAKIIYAQKYAIYPYKGTRNGTPMKYRLDKHPLAGPRWDKRMWSAEKDTITREVQNYVRTHGGK